MYLNVRFAVVAVAIAFAVPSIAAARQSTANKAARAATPDSGVVECRVLEAHSSAAPSALVVIFHQRDKQDQPRLAALIKQNSGSTEAVQIGSAAWTKVTVFRLRTCFGRGMLILPAGAAAMKDGATFRIRFSADHAAGN
jgi:hypothetical protein